MYLSVLDIAITTLALAISIILVAITAYANRGLLHENRMIRQRLRMKTDHCNNYHSPRPF
jgi:uncharacterized protein YaiI (UPF0178 family)